MSGKSNIKIAFKISDLNESAAAYKEDAKALECYISNGELVCDIYYDFKDKPLTLRAAVNKDDNVEIILMSHRIELKVNGNVCDEEWPAGNCLFDIDSKIHSNLDIHVSDHISPKYEEPTVTGTFSGISGWKPEENGPDYISYGKYHYLIYSLYGKAHYMYSKEPFEDWQIPKTPLIPCSSVPKGAVWNGKIVFTGFQSEGGYAGTIVFKSAVSDENGELIFDKE